MSFLSSLSSFWRRAVALLRPRKFRASQSDLAPAEALRDPPESAAPATPEPSLPALPPLPNRKARRAFERARRKHDKWVKPAEVVARRQDDDDAKGPKPPRLKKPAAPAAASDAEQPDDPNDRLIVDELIEGDGTEVLFEWSEFYGEFNFRDSILDQLDRYWFYLDRMKHRDPDSYGFYKKIGAVLVPRAATSANQKSATPEETAKIVREDSLELPPAFKVNRPAFGCVAYADPLVEAKEMGKVREPKFIYFTKYRRPPPEIQPMSGGDIYSVTVWWDTPRDKENKHGGTPTTFGVFVGADGKAQALRSIDTTMVTIKRKRKLDTFQIPQRAWRIPNFFAEWAEQHLVTPEQYLAHIFVLACKLTEQAHYAMTRVEVHKDDLTAVFGLSPRRTSYFFRDRDLTLTADGQRRRIFHFVRPHVRKDGTPVKASFRGERDFTWAGYRVNITVPGRDHLMLSEFNVGATDEYWRDGDEKMIYPPELADRLVEAMHRGGVKGGRQ